MLFLYFSHNLHSTFEYAIYSYHMVERESSASVQQGSKDHIPLRKRLGVWFALRAIQTPHPLDLSYPKAAKKLIEIGSPVVPRLLPLLQDKEKKYRDTVNYVLGEIKDVRAVPAILKEIEDGQEALSTFEALAKIGSREAVEPLIDYLQHGEIKAGSGSGFFSLSRIGLGDSKETCAYTLGRLKDKRAIEPLRDYLKSNWSPATVWALVELEDPKLAPVLISKINQEAPPRDAGQYEYTKAVATKGESVMALAKIGDEHAAEVAIDYLQKEKSLAAAEALIVSVNQSLDIQALEALLTNSIPHPKEGELYRDYGSVYQKAKSTLMNIRGLKEKMDQLPQEDKDRITQLILSYQPISFNLLGEIEDPRALEELLKHSSDDLNSSSYIPDNAEYVRALSHYPVRPAVERIIRALSALSVNTSWSPPKYRYDVTVPKRHREELFEERIIKDNASPNKALRSIAQECLANMGISIKDHLRYFYENPPKLNRVELYSAVHHTSTYSENVPSEYIRSESYSVYDNAERENVIHQALKSLLET